MTTIILIIIIILIIMIIIIIITIMAGPAPGGGGGPAHSAGLGCRNTRFWESVRCSTQAHINMTKHLLS